MLVKMNANFPTNVPPWTKDSTKKNSKAEKTLIPKVTIGKARSSARPDVNR